MYINEDKLVENFGYTMLEESLRHATAFDSMYRLYTKEFNKYIFWLKTPSHIGFYIG